MDDDPAFKQKYQKCKLRVKMWEKEFKQKYSRVPSKHDIREAPQEIRNSYKMYYKLKTSFLENTLNEVLLEDGFDVLEMSNVEGMMDLNETSEGVPRLPLDISAIMQTSNVDVGNLEVPFSNISDLPPSALISHDKKDVKEFEAVETISINENAWGGEVSKKTAVDLKSKTVEKKPFKSGLNHKLFKSTSFSKRNPRKALVRTKSEQAQKEGNNEDNGMKEPPLPDLETILIRKAKEKQAADAAAATIAVNPLLKADKTKESVKTFLDAGWLNRTTAENAIENSKEQRTNSKNKNIVNIKQVTYGLSNIDMSKMAPTKDNLPVNNTEEKDNKDMEIHREEKEDISAQSHEMKSLTTLKYEDNNSDSVVSDSGGEEKPSEYRHIAKRRRVLTTTNASQQKWVAADVKNNLSKEATVISKNGEEMKADEMEMDFSADDDKDKDYVASKTRKRGTTKTRKQNPRKNNVKPKEKSLKIKEENADNSKKKNVRKTKNSKSPRMKVKASDNKKSETEEVDVEKEEIPPNPKDLKYTLVLESGDITSIPRINATELKAVDELVQKYVKKSQQTISKIDTHPINEKQAAARRKLEEKIASGKLNENFVTINIQKKVFIRGKKTINYSKYKKKMWKNKKRLNELDMGGCDGGVLTCFTCGQVGHFARDCKVKGDSLLPLTAELEEDPSPFPTLEEAERMATENAVAVHSRNISKMPSAKNVAIYETDSEESKNDSNSVNEEIVCREKDENNENVESKECEGDEVCIETDEEFENFNVDDVVSNLSNEDKPKALIQNYVGHKIPADFLKKAGLDGTDTSQAATQFGNVDALYSLNKDGSVKDVQPEVMEVLRMFGHTDFRKGQDRAIMRILSGVSTLVTLSTGSGKSLCYQLPAYMYSHQKKSITLVISPLVSLMEDQVTGVPHFLRAHCLHTNQTPQQRLKVQQMISDGEVDILLVSPEAVVAGERSTGFGAILRQLPPIAFACIDEAHCVSQWSHNFRPSYLMICKVLRKNLGVRTVLGLTATATLPTRLSIIEHLGIPDGENGIISDTPLPDNLVLSISKDENKDKALVALLNSKRFETCQSVIIYCTRRDECERVSALLRTCLQDRQNDVPEKSQRKRKRVNWQAEPYHAGMPASRRRTIQKAFMGNELRIVVATIAFGMGINKPDIRAVIHYNMPRNFESYVQEVGRAGRDGKISHCHLFLDAAGNDKSELRRHIFANSIDRHVIRKLLQRVFIPCSCNKNKEETNEKSSLVPTSSAALTPIRKCPGHEIGFSVEKTVEALDIPSENISTLLCYMELDARWNINVLSSAYVMAKVISYGGPKYLKHAAKECPPLAMAIALEIKRKTFKEDSNIIEFSVVDIAAAIGWNSGIVKHQLKNLEWVQVNDCPRRSPITVNFYDLGFRLKAPGDFTSEESDDALDTLYNRTVKQEHTQLIQLQYIFQGLSAVAYNSYVPCASETFSHDRSEQLKAIIRDYFQNDYPSDLKLEIEPTDISDDDIVSDVLSLINMYPENSFSGRTIARIFHGIPSPNYPAVIWGRCKYWRAHSKVDFNRIVQVANAVIVRRRT